MIESPEIVELHPQEAVTVHGEVATVELPAFFQRAFGVAAAAATAAGVDIAGPPFAFYPAMPADDVVVEAGFAVSDDVKPDGEAHRFVLPGGRAVRAMYIGPYEGMEDGYADLLRWMSERGLHPAAGMWECYLSDPETQPDPATWRTLIVWPVS